jgi:large repetitive protein
LTPLVGQDVETFANSGLADGYTYRYRVRAWYNGSTEYTAWSNAQWATTIPAKPNLYTPSAVSATVLQPYWNEVIGDNGYKLYWKIRTGTDCAAGSWSGPVALAMNTNFYSHSPLNSGTFYCYYVVATGASGPPITQDSAASDVQTQMTLPAAPAQPTLSSITAYTITISWPDVTGDTGYKIERSLDANSWSQAGTTGPDVTTFPDSGLSPGTQYYYRISANSSIGYSSVSPAQSATTSPAAPTVTVTAISSAAIDICWPVVFSATSYKIYRKIDSGGSYGEIATPTVSYTTSYCGSPYPTVACPAPSPTTYCYPNQGLSSATTYTYYVTAANGRESLGSAEKSATTLGIAEQFLTATPLDGGVMVQLNWSPGVCSPLPCENPDYFEIQRLVRDGNWVQLKIVDGATFFYTDSLAIDPNKKYRYRVRALKGSAQSPFSEASVYAKPYVPGASVCH